MRAQKRRKKLCVHSNIVYIGRMNASDTIDFQLRWGWSKLARLYSSMAEHNGISLSVGYALLSIEKDGTPSTKLGPRMGMEKTSSSRLLNTLEAHGLIERRADDADRRVVRVHLTADGKKERDRARHAVRAFNQWMTDQLGPERVGRLLEDLQQLNINLVRYPTDATIAEVGPDANPDSNAA